ncbi:MAG: hypothetical protein ABIS43_23435 [Opitutus sp.]
MLPNSTWLKEGRTLHGNALRFFEDAGTLVKFARYDYTLVSAAFFQGILGLERALKIHFKANKGYLGELLGKAIEIGAIGESTMNDSPELTPEFSKQVKSIVGKQALSRLKCLEQLLPELRNQYFHGTYLLAPDYLHLTFQLRRMADALATES